MDVGLYGKLPSHGDFLRRRVSDAFVSAWDAWLQDCMTASRSAMGDRWLDVYLTSPVWRFSAEKGACGTAPVIGVMAPSVDRVGRYFPLTIVAELPPSVGSIAAIRAAGSFFDTAERLVVETLESEHIDFEAFDARVVQLGDVLGTVGIQAEVVLDSTAGAVLERDGGSWQLPIESAADLTPLFEQLLSSRLTQLHDPLMVWWTEGSSMVEPSCLIRRGLPEPPAFAALLDGLWQQNRWQPVTARVGRTTGGRDALSLVEPALNYRSAAATDVGRVRQVNQDSLLERSEFGLWVVADGLGGHSNGEHASRMVCDAFADFTPSSSFDDTVAAARARMQEVNDALLLGAGRSLLGDRSLSTVVALLVRGAQCAVLWAGDSRAYRWRSGRLDQLTRDHSVATEGRHDSQQDSHAVTRAVGAHSTLSLDLIRDQVHAGDRFLLCSDGLFRALPETQIRTLLDGPDIQASVAALVGGTLQVGAPDNVTALIVEACSVAP